MSAVVSTIREPLVTGRKSYHDITEDLCAPTEKAPSIQWVIGFIIAVTLLAFGVFCIAWTIWMGIGSWDLNRTINWGWDITNFVWWVGIGHAGTLISAILLLFRQKWRTGVNRAAEAMTIFAVICAGLFPLLHMGRLWLGFFIFPYPNTRGPLWVNFNSPLLWDVFAISTYFTVSLLFWYTGLVPDFATVRDRATGIRRKIYNFLSFGWTGSAKHWQRWESLSLILAGLATPLVLSVHTIVSFDFATSIIPGWHTTIFPPYFVAGAIFSGFAMVLTLMLVARKVLNLKDYITLEHMETMNKIILLTGSIVGVAYLTELFIAWYSVYPYEQFAFFNRALGPYYWSYWGMMLCNVITPQLFWSRKIRRSVFWTFFLSIIINVGMWFERFVIIATTLARDYIPSSWSYYVPTWVEIGIFIGTIGIFFTLFLIFTRVAPVVAIAEIKSILKSSGDQYVGKNADAHDGHHHAHAHADDYDDSKGFAHYLTADEMVSGTGDYVDTANNFMGSATNTVIEEVETSVTDELETVRMTLVDDLKKIEGIGPKIEELLQAAGISSYVDLAAAKLDDLWAILKAGGDRFNGNDPSTWARQALMAAEGKWDELKAWQDELDGGKE